VRVGAAGVVPDVWLLSRHVVRFLVGDGVDLIVVLDVHHHGRAHLLQVGDAGDLPGGFPRFGEDREEDSGQDSDDRDDDEEFDQGEATRPSPGSSRDRQGEAEKRR